MDAEADKLSQMARAIDTRDRAKHHYEELRRAYNRREVALSEVNQALIHYADAVNEYHDILIDIRRQSRRQVLGDSDASQ